MHASHLTRRFLCPSHAEHVNTHTHAQYEAFINMNVTHIEKVSLRAAKLAGRLCGGRMLMGMWVRFEHSCTRWDINALGPAGLVSNPAKNSNHFTHGRSLGSSGGTAGPSDTADAAVALGRSRFPNPLPPDRLHNRPRVDTPEPQWFAYISAPDALGLSGSAKAQGEANARAAPLASASKRAAHQAPTPLRREGQATSDLSDGAGWW